jgi:ankyrin repeat protein
MFNTTGGDYAMLQFQSAKLMCRIDVAAQAEPSEWMPHHRPCMGLTMPGLRLVGGTWHNMLTCRRRLLINGAHPNEPNVRGDTPIKLASKFGHVVALDLLLSNHVTNNFQVPEWADINATGTSSPVPPQSPFFCP